MPRKPRLVKMLLLLSLCYLLAIGLIWLDGYTSTYQTAPFAVVLGNQVYPSGEMSTRLKARTQRAAELYRTGHVQKIIVSGGLGREGHDEAVVMKQFLEAQGIPSPAIIADSAGLNTRLTATNALKWADPQQPIIVVSQLYHLSRTKMAFRQAGFKQVQAAYPLYFERRDITASLREVVAWLKYALH